MTEFPNYTNDGQSRAGAQAIAPTRQSKRAQILLALADGPLTTSAAAQIGGSEATRRIRELRQSGFPIRTSRVPNSTEFLYELMP